MPGRMRLIDMTGQTYGRLTVVGRAGSNAAGATWLCACSCGGTVTVGRGELIHGKTKSCGCFRRAHSRSSKTQHDHAAYRAGRRTTTYVVWTNMLQRTTNPRNPAWQYYGGRGIAVCDQWRQFENFLADMGERPSGLTLDRIDNDGNYEPGNCRWATWREQRLNQRRNGKAPA